LHLEFDENFVTFFFFFRLESIGFSLPSFTQFRDAYIWQNHPSRYKSSWIQTRVEEIFKKESELFGVGGMGGMGEVTHKDLLAAPVGIYDLGKQGSKIPGGGRRGGGQRNGVQGLGGWEVERDDDEFYHLVARGDFRFLSFSSIVCLLSIVRCLLVAC
jgi:hypothetical protein